METGKNQNQGWQKKAADLAARQGSIAKLANSGDAKRLMELLKQQGGVESAARQAADGDPKKLLEMMNELMRSPQGAQLVQNIDEQARKAGLR